MSVYIGGLLVARVLESTAGGVISGPGATKAMIDGKKISLNGDSVIPHGISLHASATVIATHNSRVTIGNIGTSGGQLDDTQVGWPFNTKFFLILNLAVGGMFGGDVDDNSFPWTFQIKNVKVTQNNSVIFEDNFSTNGAPDSSKWIHETGNDNGFGNDELEYYTNSISNSFVSNNTLNIVARKEEVGGFHYTSARMTTSGKFSFLYGKVDVLAKMPVGFGSWPAIWMLSDSITNGSVGWPDCGEIDIAEVVGKKPNFTQVSLHSGGYNRMKPEQKTHIEPWAGLSDDFHLYSMDWKEDSITFLVDNTVIVKYNKSGSKLPSGENGGVVGNGKLIIVETDPATCGHTVSG